MEIILNKCYGVFELSEKAYLKWAEKLGAPVYAYAFDFHENKYVKVGHLNPKYRHKTYLFIDYGEYLPDDFNPKAVLTFEEKDRTDLCLIEAVKELGEEANGTHANLKVVEIPDELADKYVIDDYDGYETLHEKVQIW